MNFEFLENSNSEKVLQAMRRYPKGEKEMALLLSPGADELLEEMARLAHRITLARFGRVVGLYAPLYLSNKCVGNCPYCGFKNLSVTNRKTLTIKEIKQEAIALKKSGMKQILLVSGDYYKDVNIDYLEKAVHVVTDVVPSTSIEVAPLSYEDYKKLMEAGADGVTLYQETYDKKTYCKLHCRGPKSDYEYRFSALDRAGRAGMRKLTAGALWGLSPWRQEALNLAMHAARLQKKYWKSSVSIGLPRLKTVPDDFCIPNPINDRQLVHIILAFRIFLNDAQIVLSTREPAELRDNLLQLGITTMSAGSSTEPGGYNSPGTSDRQFEISDTRSPFEVAKCIEENGYEPVWKDWDRGFYNTAR